MRRIAKCQQENGGGWAFPIPEKYLHWLRRGKRVWAPQYVCHKVMMGVLDMYRYADNAQAFEVLLGCADWFYLFTADITREKMDAMMDLEETGGIMELWTDLYGVTGDARHLGLVRRYERPHLYEPLLAGRDPLTNMHANSTIPEIHGAARAYEVTGDERYRKVVEAHWRQAVDTRGAFVTGGQTSGEVWTPPGEQSARLGNKNQEHCTVHNMMRLADYLYRWTGDGAYADYWELNLYNGIYAHGYWEDGDAWLGDPNEPSRTGHVCYYLPLEAGAVKRWGSLTEHFWCCHGTLVQANANFYQSIFFQNGDAITVAQYLPAELTATVQGAEVHIAIEEDPLGSGSLSPEPVNAEIGSRPDCLAYRIRVRGGGRRFALRLRKPDWLAGPMEVAVDGLPAGCADESGYLTLELAWDEDEIALRLPMKLTARPETFLIPDNERQWGDWQPVFRTVDQPVNFRFAPIYYIGYEPYTTYFQVKPRE